MVAPKLFIDLVLEFVLVLDCWDDDEREDE
jgi:hypothetical protein